MRPWLLLLLLSLLCTAVLGFYVFRLQSEVHRLSAAVGSTDVVDGVDAPEGAPSEGTQGALARRVAALEEELKATNGRVALLHARQKLAAGSTESDAPDETPEQVRSIVSDEVDRMFAEQLLWHRQNLMSARKPGFRAFAEQADLTQAERNSVWRLLEAEADEFVELFRVKELREDPEAMVREIRAVLDATDDRVRLLLDEDQIDLYKRGRAVERGAIMPWLDEARP